MAIFDFATSFLTSAFIFQIFIPFIILFAIVWGLLEAIGKLGHRANAVVALGFALIASYANPFILFYIANLGSMLAVILFGILFLFGVIRWGLSRGHDIYFETSSYKRQREHYERELEKVNKKIAHGTGLSEGELRNLVKRQQELKETITVLKAREQQVG